VIEEKSSRIVEVMLSSVTPRQFMIGKLLGAAGASLLTLVLWLAMAAMATWIFVPGGHGLVRVAAFSLASSHYLPLLIVCFLCGLLIYASIFLAIGSMTASLQDAQALLGPTVIVIMAPLLIMPALLSDPNGMVSMVMTWIPLYTPFFMMFRLPWHPPPLQVWAGMALMIATTGLLVWQMGRIFSAHLLTSDRPPGIIKALRALAGFKKA
jgi:ABC-2 type transport system permease protein